MFSLPKKAFTENNINILKTSKKSLPNDIKLQTPQVKNKGNCDNIYLPSPSKKTKLSPIQLIENINIGKSSGLLDEDEEKPAISGFNGMIRFQNELVPKKNDLNVKDEDKDVKNVIKNSDQIYNSPSVFLKKIKNRNYYVHQALLYYIKIRKKKCLLLCL